MPKNGSSMKYFGSEITLSNESSFQGDVGSGKTVVAAIALFASVTAGFQGALMVPTEILAEQHAESLNKYVRSCWSNPASY